MRIRLSKWGNSLGLRMPRELARRLGVAEGSQVEMEVSRGRLVISPVEARPDLAELVAGITPQNLHGETAAGRAVGAEVID